MDRGSRAGEIVDLIDLDVERERHIVAHEVEVLVLDEMLDVAPRAGEEIIDAQHIGAFPQQPLAKMRAEEARASGDQHARFKMHVGFAV